MAKLDESSWNAMRTIIESAIEANAPAVVPQPATVEPLPLTMNVEEARRQLGGVTRQTLYRWEKQGKLQRVNVEGVVLYTTRSILALCDAADNHADKWRVNA